MARRSALIYLAAILDGEGSLTMSQSRADKQGVRWFREKISVGNCDPRLPAWLKTTFGGNVYVNMPADGKRKPSWRWELGDRKACDLLRQVRPYLLLKGGQADILIAHRALARPWGGYYRGTNRYQDVPGRSEQRSALRAQLHVLNRKGVASGA